MPAPAFHKDCDGAVNRLIIEIFIVKLGMIMGLHKLSIAKLIYRGWNTCNGNGKIIGPGLDGEVDFQAFWVCLFRRLDMFGCLLHKGSVFIGTADCILLSMGMGRKLEVKSAITFPCHSGWAVNTCS